MSEVINTKRIIELDATEVIIEGDYIAIDRLEGTYKLLISDLIEAIQSTNNYDDLLNRPAINGVTLTGNKTASDFGYGLYINSEGKMCMKKGE